MRFINHHNITLETPSYYSSIAMTNAMTKAAYKKSLKLTYDFRGLDSVMVEKRHGGMNS